MHCTKNKKTTAMAGIAGDRRMKPEDFDIGKPPEEEAIPYDHFGLCPRCCRKPVRRDYRMHHFMCCDHCRVYWWVGTNIMTPYQSLVWGGVFDDEIGGPGNRGAEVKSANVETAALPDTYDEVN